MAEVSGGLADVAGGARSGRQHRARRCRRLVGGFFGGPLGRRHRQHGGRTSSVASRWRWHSFDFIDPVIDVVGDVLPDGLGRRRDRSHRRRFVAGRHHRRHHRCDQRSRWRRGGRHRRQLRRRRLAASRAVCSVTPAPADFSRTRSAGSPTRSGCRRASSTRSATSVVSSPVARRHHRGGGRSARGRCRRHRWLRRHRVVADRWWRRRLPRSHR